MRADLDNRQIPAIAPVCGTAAGSSKLWTKGTVFFAVLVLLLYFDSTIYHFLHVHWCETTRPVPPFLRLPTRLMRSMENWGEEVYIGFVLFAMWRLDPTRRGRVFCLILSALLVSAAAEGIKRMVGRARPEVAEGRLVLRGYVPGDGRGDWHSFPSGHVASAASYSGSLAAFYPPLKPACILLAAGCAASRIWKERHFASDCWFAGALGFWAAGSLATMDWMRRWMRAFDARFSQTPDEKPTRPRLAA